MIEEFNITNTGDRKLILFQNACQYSYTTTDSDLKFEVVADYLIVETPRFEGIKTFTLTGTYKGLTKIFNFTGGLAEGEENFYYFGSSSTKPQAEKDYISNKTAIDKISTFTISQTNKHKYFWILIPEGKDIIVKDNLDDPLHWDLPCLEVKEILIDDKKYFLYLLRSDLNISNTYKIQING